MSAQAQASAGLGLRAVKNSLKPQRGEIYCTLSGLCDLEPLRVPGLRKPPAWADIGSRFAAADFKCATSKRASEGQPFWRFSLAGALVTRKYRNSLSLDIDYLLDIAND